MNNILEIRNLIKNYEGFSLNDVSFGIPAGYIMGFIGPNGAGKTTTIKSILNIVRPDSGEISLFGNRAPHTDRGIMNDIGVVMDFPYYLDAWKVKDVEAAVSPFYKGWNHDIFTSSINKFEISKNKQVKNLSRGMKVKLMVAVAMSHNAKLLILDEPTSGLDPVARDELMDILSNYISNGDKGILFSTHITSDLEKIADYITFIIDGKIQFTGEKDILIESYLLVKGGLSDLTERHKKYIIGLRENGYGFEGMVKAGDQANLPRHISFEKISLDEIIVFMNKGDKLHGQSY
ncbi:MAG: ABC transporter ATP-binding protein [Clostridiales bacterium]|jgi:ABC-2 type transport system ATP-binding protein|nr:ABC transporter ATP-binding protein [Clostridiales bacterium]